LSQKLGVSKRVHFLGFVSEEKKFQYLANSDLYVLSSLHEGFGIVLQEAMQVGLPIVATNYGGQTDILKEGENAFLINPKSFKEIRTAILRIYGKLDIIQNLSRNNLLKNNKFAPNKIAERYIKTL